MQTYQILLASALAPGGGAVATRVMNKFTKNLKAKLAAAGKSATVIFLAMVPVLQAVVQAAQEQLPALAGVLTGWNLVAFSVAVAALGAVLRVRRVRHHEPTGNQGGQGGQDV